MEHSFPHRHAGRPKAIWGRFRRPRLRPIEMGRQRMMKNKVNDGLGATFTARLQPPGARCGLSACEGAADHGAPRLAC